MNFTSSGDETLRKSSLPILFSGPDMKISLISGNTSFATGYDGGGVGGGGPGGAAGGGGPGGAVGVICAPHFIQNFAVEGFLSNPQEGHADGGADGGAVGGAAGGVVGGGAAGGAGCTSGWLQLLQTDAPTGFITPQLSHLTPLGSAAGGGAAGGCTGAAGGVAGGAAPSNFMPHLRQNVSPSGFSWLQ